MPLAMLVDLHAALGLPATKNELNPDLSGFVPLDGAHLLAHPTYDKQAFRRNFLVKLPDFQLGFHRPRRSAVFAIVLDGQLVHFQQSVFRIHPPLLLGCRPQHV